MHLPEGATPSRRADNTLVKARARAFRWKRMLGSDEFTTIVELAEREGIAPSYMTRVLRLTLLAPDIVEAILDGKQEPDDHRHHAIDAAVVGVIDRRMGQVLQTHPRNLGVERLDRVLPDPPQPFAGFRDAVLAAVEKVNVSHRAQHGSTDPNDASLTSGRLHEDTACGLVRDVAENQAERTISNVVVRRPVTGLTEKEIGQVRDVKLRHGLEEATRSARDKSLPETKRKKRLSEALVKWVQDTGHRKLRILQPKAGARPVHDRDGKSYKWLVPGEISWLDILEAPDGSWFYHATDIRAANSGGVEPWHVAHPGARFIMRVHKNDTVQLFDWDDKENSVVEGSNRIKRVVRLSPSNSVIYLVGVNDAGDHQKRHDDADDPFRWDFANIGKLKLRRARRVRIDELGRVHTIPHEAIQKNGLTGRPTLRAHSPKEALMVGRILELTKPGLLVHKRRGVLAVDTSDGEAGRISSDDVEAVLVASPGLV